ncbi:MAG: Cgl0159 family (beta/alpha)8-fold protein [Terriglobia bacterium]
MARGSRLEGFLDAGTFEQITELRVHRPRLVEQEARRRKRRTRLARDGKLVLVALDHPARGVNAIRGDSLAMGDRFEYLSRARRVLADSDLDGVLASPDVMEELFLVNYLERRRGGPGFLDGRVLVGSMNRGGIAGTSFEMEDAFTGFTAQRLAALRCDGGKMLWRLDPHDPAAGRTMHACAVAMNELRLRRLPVFLEPLGVEKHDERYEVMRDAATLVRQCGIAAGMSESSQNVWLKLPYGDGFARVCRATTLPILLLGGPAREDPIEAVSDFAAGLAVSPRVRGAVIGRNLLFPGRRDPFLMSRALTALVHRGAAPKEAIAVMSGREG